MPNRMSQDLERLHQASAQAAAMLQAIANPNRLLVLCLLIANGEMAVGAINQVLGLSPSALSQHLAKMREEGLISYRREAQTLYYRIHDSSVEKLVAVLKERFCPELPDEEQNSSPLSNPASIITGVSS